MGFFRRLFSSGSGGARHHYESGLAWQQNGDHDQAIAEFTEAIRLDPQAVNAYYSRGLAYEEKNDIDNALADLQKVLSLRPESGWADRKLIEQALQGEDVIAREDVEQAVARVMVARGIIFYSQGEYQKAIGDFSEAIRLNPSGSAHFERGRAYYLTGQFKEAVDDLDRAASSNPEDAGLTAAIYFYLGDSYREMREYDKAVFNVKISIRRAPEVPDSYESRGLAYFEKGENDKAVSDFTEAIRLDPKKASYYLNRARVHRAMGHEDQAVADERMAQKLSE
jgi:tetratricopeptide (TPR) repeat protein